MRAFIKAFFVGIVAILVFNQGVLWALSQLSLASTTFWNAQGLFGTGIPAVAWVAAWGGVWGFIVWLLVRHAQAAGYYVGAVIMSAVLMTGVLLVAAPWPDMASFGVSLAEYGMRSIVAMLVANAVYGLGFAVLMRLIHPPR